MVTTLDGIKQRDVRQQKAELENISKELENQAKAQQIEEARQKAKHRQQMEELEFQKRQAEVMFELEQKRADLLERTLEMLNKNRINATEIAIKNVHILLPDGDPTTKLMLSQSLLPDILQLQDIKGLELVSLEQPPQVDEGNPKEDTKQ